MRLIADPARPGELRHRRAMAEALGWFGDPRMSKPQRWVEVQPARFWTGTVPGDPDHKRYAIDWEHPGRWHDALPHVFHIQRWPVTVGEYAPFVDAGGYRQDIWWDDDPKITNWRRSPAGEPDEWDEQRRRSPNTPVIGNMVRGARVVPLARPARRQAGGREHPAADRAGVGVRRARGRGARALPVG